MTQPDELQPARHEDPAAGPTAGWSADQFGAEDYVGDAETEQVPLAADGTQADPLLGGDDAVD